MPINIDLDYADVPAGAGEVDAKRLRGRHPLYSMDGSTPLNGWLQSIPMDGAPVNGVEGVMPGTVAKIVCSYVQCGEDAAGMSLGDHGKITADAWNRFLKAITAIHGGEGERSITLGKLYEDVDKKIAQATPEQREALVLRAADLEASHAVMPAPAPLAVGADAEAQRAHAQLMAEWEGNPEHPYAWLQYMRFDGLADEGSGRLAALGRLMAAVPSWVSRGVRAEPGFARALKMIAAAALDGTDYCATVANDAAEGIAMKLKLIDLPRAMESFGGASQEARTRALAREMRAVGTPSVRQELLRERFLEVIAHMAGMRAVVGVRADSCDINGSTAFALCAEMAARMGIVRAEAAFQWAQLRDLRDAIGHLDEMLLAAPWVHRTARERADYVIDMHRTQVRRVASTMGTAAPSTGGGGGGGASTTATAEARGRGAVPKHFLAEVAPAMATAPYRSLKAALLARFALGGRAADLDVLQLAASGVALDAHNRPLARQWCPLIAMLAEGADKGIDAALLDPDLQVLTTAASTAWPELIARTVCMQVSADRASLHANHEGVEFKGLAKQFASPDWSTINMGEAYNMARALLRGQKHTPEPSGSAYTTLQSIEHSIEVAEALLMLRGFGGNGEGTLPFALEQVRSTWLLYGSAGASRKILATLANEGREYIVAILAHFGSKRHAALASKNPLAPDHSRRAPAAATARWQRHERRLAGALEFESYVSYAGGGEDRDDESGASGKRGGGAWWRRRQLGQEARSSRNARHRQHRASHGCARQAGHADGHVARYSPQVRPQHHARARRVSAELLLQRHGGQSHGLPAAQGVRPGARGRLHRACMEAWTHPQGLPR